MHELSLALSILDAADSEADRQGLGLVSAIHVELGALSGVTADALISAFELARGDSRFPNVELKIEEIELEAYCRQCAVRRTLELPRNLHCPSRGRTLLT